MPPHQTDNHPIQNDQIQNQHEKLLTKNHTLANTIFSASSTSKIPGKFIQDWLHLIISMNDF